MQPPTRGPTKPETAGAATDPIVQRLRSWAKEPTLDATLVLCDELRAAPGLRAQHVDALARALMQRLAKEPRALIELGRLQMQVGKLGEAQQTLVAAGRLDAQAAAPYRFLGEVLLRRGDVPRAERMLEKAVEIVSAGADLLADPALDVEGWLEHARALRPVHEQKGEAAVAAEMSGVPTSELAAPARAPGARRSLPPPTPIESPADDEPTQVAAIPSDLREKLKPSVSTNYGKAAPPSPKPATEAPAKRSVVPPPIPKSQPPAAMVRDTSDDTIDTTDAEGARLVRDAIARSKSDDEGAEEDQLATIERPAFDAKKADEPAPRAFGGAFDPPRTAPIVEPPKPQPPPQKLARLEAKLPSFRPGAPASLDDEAPVPASPMPKQQDDASPPPGPNPLATGRMRSLAANAVTFSGRSARGESTGAPEPAAGEAWPAERVLDALASAGLYERAAAASSPAQWVARRDVGRERGRGSWLYALIAVLAIGGIGGGLAYGQHRKAQQRLEAETLTASAEANVRKGSLNALAQAEAELGKALELDSRTQPGARIWLADRVLRAMMWPGDSRREGGLAGAIERGKTVGLTEDEMSFARIALALGSDDTAGAVTLAKSKEQGHASKKEDAWTELAVGWVLERAGDLRAIERYANAQKLDPELVPARLYLAKLAALGGDEAKVAELTKGMPDDLGPTVADLGALATLSKTGVPGKGGAGDAVRPAGLGWIAPALVAADPKADLAARRKEAARAFALAREPGDLVRVGRLASVAGDQALASRAALHALEVSPIFPPARVLAARLALYVGRPDDAARALDGVQNPGDPELASLRAWLAYERGDVAAIAAALDDASLPPNALDRPDVQSITRALRVAQKSAARGAAKLEAADAAEITALRTLDEPGPSVAFDLAIEAADLKLAQELAKDWTDVEARPARALRLARLSRLGAKAEDADRYSRIAVEQGTVSPAALVERVLVLAAIGKAADGLAMLTRNPLLAVDEQPWLRAYASAQSGKVGDAKKALETQADPDAKASFAVRRDALLAFAAVGDGKRGKPLAKALLAERPNDPDVVANAKLLGVTVKDLK
jgi:hypothetical protein